MRLALLLLPVLLLLSQTVAKPKPKPKAKPSPEAKAKPQWWKKDCIVTINGMIGDCGDIIVARRINASLNGAYNNNQDPVSTSQCIWPPCPLDGERKQGFP